MVATQESSRLAKVLIAQSCSKQVIEPGDLTLHADRGSSMSSRALALLLADLGVTKSHVSASMSVTTIPSRNPNSRPSSTVQNSRLVLASIQLRQRLLSGASVDWYNRRPSPFRYRPAHSEDVHYRSAVAHTSQPCPRIGGRPCTLPGEISQRQTPFRLPFPRRSGSTLPKRRALEMTLQ